MIREQLKKPAFPAGFRGGARRAHRDKLRPQLTINPTFRNPRQP